MRKNRAAQLTTNRAATPTPGAAVPTPSGRAKAEKGNTTKPRVLIVDDEPAIRELLREMLAPVAAYIDTAGSFAHARHLLSNISYDIALLDNRLGDGNGLDLLKLIRRDAPRTLVAMVTSDAREPDFIQQATENGAVKVIGKPFARREITQLFSENPCAQGGNR